MQGVDAVIDTIGGETQQRSWRVIKPGGVLVALRGAPPSPAGSRPGSGASPRPT